MTTDPTENKPSHSAPTRDNESDSPLVNEVPSTSDVDVETHPAGASETVSTDGSDSAATDEPNTVASVAADAGKTSEGSADTSENAPDPDPANERKKAADQWTSSAHATEEQAVSAATVSQSVPKRGHWGLLLAVVLLFALGIAGWRGWEYWQRYSADMRQQTAAAASHVQALGERIDNLSADMRSQNQRIQGIVSTHTTLRDEMIGIRERAEVLEQGLTRLTESNRHSVDAVRLGEVEVLLVFGDERLNTAGDIPGARRIYALAADVLEDIDSMDTGIINLRQTLAQERAALDRLGDDPRRVLEKRLDAFAVQLEALPQRSPPPENRPVWQQWLSAFVDIRPTQQRVLLAPRDRTAADMALQLELSLARSALERGDSARFQQALSRVDHWLDRLWPDSPALDASRVELHAIGHSSLTLAFPEQGTTLQQLGTIRAGESQ